MDACLLHCINHCSKTAELIKKNSQQLKAEPDAEAPRDQGFTRPKVCPDQAIGIFVTKRCGWTHAVGLLVP